MGEVRLRHGLTHHTRRHVEGGERGPSGSIPLLTPWRQLNASLHLSGLSPERWTRSDAFDIRKVKHVNGTCPARAGVAAGRPMRCGQLRPPAAQSPGLAPRFLLGVLSAPSHLALREEIRQTWRSADATPDDMLVCFVIGQYLSSGELERAVEREYAERRDVVRIDTRDGHSESKTCDMSRKTFTWFLWAARVVAAHRAIEFVAKVDDDTLLVLPRLRALVDGHSCLNGGNIFIGTLAFTSGSPLPTACKTCGTWSWSLPLSIRHWVSSSDRCADDGFHPPHPFGMGWMFMLSARVLARITSDVSHEAAIQYIDSSGSQCNTSRAVRPARGEEHHFGFWLASTQRANPSFRVAYLDLGNRLAHPFGCYNHYAGRTWGHRIHSERDEVPPHGRRSWIMDTGHATCSGMLLGAAA